MAFVTIEDRVDLLEALFGQFLTEGALLRKHADERAKEAEERHKAAEERHKAAEERHKAAELLAEERHKAVEILAEERNKAAEERNKAAEERHKAVETLAEERNKAAEERMNRFLEDMRRDREEMKADRKEMNRKWGDLSNKLGHIVEDIMGPNLPRLAVEHFGAREVDSVMLRVERRDPQEHDRWQEFDAVVSGPDLVLVGEAKSTPRTDDPDKFADKLAEFPRFFPEFAGRPIIGVFGSWSVPENVEKRLTKLGIYCLQMGDETMQLTNAAQVDAGG